MSSLNYFDIIIMILFLIVSFSVYKTLKSDNPDMDFPPFPDSKGQSTKLIRVLKTHNKQEYCLDDTIQPDTAEQKVEKLLKVDKTFDTLSFMLHAKAEFEYILKHFCEKDMKSLKSKTSQNVYDIFENSIKELEKHKYSICSEIIRFKKVAIKDIKVAKNYANVIVEFITEQTGVIKDNSGKIIKGDDNRIDTIKDIWCFSKNLISKNSKWVLSATIEA